ncbi:MAG: glycine dehydrogenase (aminomethyl-transferring), partial [Candidatus Hydrogenedentota bacterium]
MGYAERHIGPTDAEQKEMLKVLHLQSLEELVQKTIPKNILLSDEEKPKLPKGKSEQEVLAELRELAKQNKPLKSFYGYGYYGTHTPAVIQRGILENPGWYTQYTPYQSEISQGRLEALLNFQTMVADLTSLPIANASLLDEATAAAEAASMMLRLRPKEKKDAKTLLCHEGIFEHTLDVVKNRMSRFGIEVKVLPAKEIQKDLSAENVFGVLWQIPEKNGELSLADAQEAVKIAKTNTVQTAAICDILALTLITPPGELGFDIAVGSTQRFGVPMGFGGPHAAYMAATEHYTRQMPGRIIGISKDRRGHKAYRMSLQTREQHIRREKATSNICTAQALLAIMASMYAVWHGPEGLKNIASDVHSFASRFYAALQNKGIIAENTSFFDCVTFSYPEEKAQKVLQQAYEAGFLLQYNKKKQTFSINFDETTTEEDFKKLL